MMISASPPRAGSGPWARGSGPNPAVTATTTTTTATATTTTTATTPTCNDDNNDAHLMIANALNVFFAQGWARGSGPGPSATSISFFTNL